MKHCISFVVQKSSHEIFVVPDQINVVQKKIGTEIENALK